MATLKPMEKLKFRGCSKKKTRTPNEMEIWYEGDDILSVDIYDDDKKLLLYSISR
jgi:hypothetical protein